MEILDISIYNGRNIYSHRPVMKTIVDIGRFSDIPTKDIKGFNDRLLTCFPNLKNNTCGLGYAGGFLQRLEEGTYLAHVLEHVILDLQNTLGFDVKYGKTRFFKEPSQYFLVYEFENEICALECSKAAVFILNCFLNGEDIIIGEFLEYLNKVQIETQLGPSTAAIVNEAKKRGIPVTRIGYESLVRLGYGKYSKVIQATLTDTTSCIAADISSNKQLTKHILDENKIPVPYGKVVYTEVSAVMAAKQIGFPVVVKPFNSNQGKGVNTNITNEKDVRKAFREAAKYSAGIIVEKYIVGNDYRILVVDGEVKAVAQRLPAMVVGDGIHTISELIEEINKDTNRGECHEKPLTKIKLGSLELSVLKKKGYSKNYVPRAGEKIALRENGNISTGGTAIDCTDIIHPDNADIAVNAANAIGIDIAGIDMVAEDVSKSIYSTSGAVIEVNTAPGIRMHLYPSQGQPRNVAKDIVDLLFPKELNMDFPIVSVTGTNGKTTTVRLIGHVLSHVGRKVGMTSTSGTFIDGKCICKGDHSGPCSARALLANKSIDAAVFETARGGIIREGLGYDLADVGIVTNIAEDHLGLGGVETLKDLAFVKALVVEAIKPGGCAVLNAEDEMTNFILERVQEQVILFYKTKDNVKVKDVDKYINVFVEDGFIKIRDSNREITALQIKDIPITYGGLLECNIENALASVCALYALKIPVEDIAKGLASFESNPGRFQIFHMDGYKIMLDYAHNEAGYMQVTKLCQKLCASRIVGIIGMPGDRPDKAIKSVGVLAAKAFDRIYIKEDRNLRNRKKHEVANLLYGAVAESSYDMEKVKIIDDEVEALKEAMKNAQKDDLIVVMYEKIEPLTELIKQRGSI
ncbi:MAG: cyanophycin synthetase [Eubacteriales bacterium]|nr:cyanophycin synthetase [Eubacteriales bacterium]